MKKKNERVGGLMWSIRAIHRAFPKNKRFRKVFWGQDKRSVDEDFRLRHADMYHSVWRGWLRIPGTGNLAW